MPVRVTEHAVDVEARQAGPDRMITDIGVDWTCATASVMNIATGSPRRPAAHNCVYRSARS